MMLMGYWSCAVQPGTAMTAHGDDEVRRHKGCRTFLLRPRAPRPSDPELPHAEANLPTRYPTHRKQRGGQGFRYYPLQSARPDNAGRVRCGAILTTERGIAACERNH